KTGARAGDAGGPPDPASRQPHPLRRVDAFLAEVRKIEAEWFSELVRKLQGFIVGSSPWTGRSALQDQIKTHRGFAPDDVLVRSITACLREGEQIDADRTAEMRRQNWPPADPHCAEYHERECWFDFVRGNCLVRNIPRQCLV